MTAGIPTRSEDELTEGERALLSAAYAELRAAVAAYDQYQAKPLSPGIRLIPLPAEELAEAQRRIEVAEVRLWDLRERFLGWRRPRWAPAAAEVSDWFSEEDAAYDELDGVWAE